MKITDETKIKNSKIESEDSYFKYPEFIKSLNALFSRFPEKLPLLDNFPVLVSLLELNFSWMETTIHDYIEKLLAVLQTIHSEDYSHSWYNCYLVGMELWESMSTTQQNKLVEIFVASMADIKKFINHDKSLPALIIPRCEVKYLKDIYQKLFNLLAMEDESDFYSLKFMDLMVNSFISLYKSFPEKQDSLITELIEYAAKDILYCLSRCPQKVAKEIGLNAIVQLYPELKNKDKVLDLIEPIYALQSIPPFKYKLLFETAYFLLPHLSIDKKKKIIECLLLETEENSYAQAFLLPKYFYYFSNYKDKITNTMIQFTLKSHFFSYSLLTKDFLNEFTQDQLVVYLDSIKKNIPHWRRSRDIQNLKSPLQRCTEIYPLIDKEHKEKVILILLSLILFENLKPASYLVDTSINALFKLLEFNRSQIVVTKGGKLLFSAWNEANANHIGCPSYDMGELIGTYLQRKDVKNIYALNKITKNYFDAKLKPLLAKPLSETKDEILAENMVKITTTLEEAAKTYNSEDIKLSLHKLLTPNTNFIFEKLNEKAKLAKINTKTFFEEIALISKFEFIPPNLFLHVSKKAQNYMLKRFSNNITRTYNMPVETYFPLACFYYTYANKRQRDYLFNRTNLCIEHLQAENLQLAIKIFSTLHPLQIVMLQRRLNYIAYENIDMTNSISALKTMDQACQALKVYERLNFFKKPVVGYKITNKDKFFYSNPINRN